MCGAVFWNEIQLTTSPHQPQSALRSRFHGERSFSLRPRQPNQATAFSVFRLRPILECRAFETALSTPSSGAILLLKGGLSY